MSLQQNTMESERPDPSKNYIERLPSEIFDEIIETFNEMERSKGMINHKALVPLCSVSKKFLASANRLLYRDPEVYSTIPSLRSGTEEMLWCIKRLRSIASGIIKNRQLANYVKDISLRVVHEIHHGSVFINEGDMQCLAPMLPDLQKLANETPGRKKLLPVEDGDNILDAFLEALCALCPNAQRITMEMSTVLCGFPRILRLASDLDLPLDLTICTPEPKGELTDYTTWTFRRQNGSSHFTLDLQKSALFLYRDIIQSATVYDLASLRIKANEQTWTEDVEDDVSTFKTHKTIKILTLDWEPGHSGNPSEPHLRTGYLSLEGLQNLEQLKVNSRVLKKALMGPSEGSFAHRLPKSLKTLHISDDCEDWQLGALRDLVQGKHLPNLSCVVVGEITGSSGLLQECCNEMAAAEIDFHFTPKPPGQSESPNEEGG